MARIRSIHPDALKSEKLAAAGAEAERCYWRLSTYCDDDGRAEDHPRLIWATLFPLNDDATADLVNVWLDKLATIGLLVRYEVDGSRYLQVTRWADYQKPQRKVESKLPSIPEGYASSPRGVTEDARTPPRDVSPGVGEGEGVGDGDGGESSSSTSSTALELVRDDPVVIVFEAWQSSTGKARAVLDPKRRRLITAALKNYELEDVCAAVHGWKLSPHHRGENERHTVYNDIELILRDSSHIENFRDLHRNGNSPVPPKNFDLIERALARAEGRA